MTQVSDSGCFLSTSLSPSTKNYTGVLTIMHFHMAGESDPPSEDPGHTGGTMSLLTWECLQNPPVESEEGAERGWMDGWMDDSFSVRNPSQ